MNYATNLWYAALWAEDLAAGALQSRTICEQSIVFFRGPDGEACWRLAGAQMAANY